MTPHQINKYRLNFSLVILPVAVDNFMKEKCMKIKVQFILLWKHLGIDFHQNIDNYQMKNIIVFIVKFAFRANEWHLTYFEIKNIQYKWQWLELSFHFFLSSFSFSFSLRPFSLKFCFTFMFTVASNCSLDSTVLRYIHFVALFGQMSIWNLWIPE